jgi:hypothetical protein
MVINLFRKYIIGIFYENESLSDNKYENEKNVELLSFFKIKLDRNFFFKICFAIYLYSIMNQNDKNKIDKVNKKKLFL